MWAVQGEWKGRFLQLGAGSSSCASWKVTCQLRKRCQTVFFLSPSRHPASACAEEGGTEMMSWGGWHSRGCAPERCGVKGNREPMSIFLLCFTSGDVIRGAKPWLSQSSLFLCPHLPPCLAPISVKPQCEWAPHMKALGIHCEGQHFKESHKHPAHQWVGSDFSPCRCGQEN